MGLADFIVTAPDFVAAKDLRETEERLLSGSLSVYSRCRDQTMRQKIVDFDQDEVGDWRAVLTCGHRQHVRDNPPFVSRPWVLIEDGRRHFLGYTLNCKRCDEAETAG